MINIIKKLMPLNRSLMGEGNLKTLKILKTYNKNLQIKSFRSNEKFYDWRIPNEWLVKDAYIITPENNKICDFKKNNLHLLGYSIKIKKKIDLKQLQKNLFSNKSVPEAIPYVTSYYKKNWGFCIKHSERKKLSEGKYQVFINTEFKKGKMYYGEILIKGKFKKEILFSTYICHPSMANNELSGPSLAITLSNYLSKKKKIFLQNFIFIRNNWDNCLYK